LLRNADAQMYRAKAGHALAEKNDGREGGAGYDRLFGLQQPLRGNA
jgi:hypothetical protein